MPKPDTDGDGAGCHGDAENDCLEHRRGFYCPFGSVVPEADSANPAAPRNGAQ